MPYLGKKIIKQTVSEAKNAIFECTRTVPQYRFEILSFYFFSYLIIFEKTMLNAISRKLNIIKHLHFKGKVSI